jgi:hypothetical protein
MGFGAKDCMVVSAEVIANANASADTAAITISAID